MKPIHWLGDSRKAIGAFPSAARQAAGYQLFRVQSGLDPHDWKPMQSVGAGVREIRVHVDGEWRVLYLAARPEAVYVLHALRKKSRRTPAPDLALARERLKQLEAGRR